MFSTVWVKPGFPRVNLCGTPTGLRTGGSCSEFHASKEKLRWSPGAEHPLGVSLCQRLAGFGATVVAVGRSDETLMALARQAPRRIEPLVLRSGRRDVMDLLRESWADEPLDFYADLLPLAPDISEKIPHDLFALSAGMSAALLRGVRNGGALCVLAIPVPAAEGASAPEDHAKAAGYTAMLKRFANQGVPGRHVGLRVLSRSRSWTPAQCISAGDMMLTLFHPVSRGVRNGSVIDWSPEDA